MIFNYIRRLFKSGVFSKFFEIFIESEFKHDSFSSKIFEAFPASVSVFWCLNVVHLTPLDRYLVY